MKYFVKLFFSFLNTVSYCVVCKALRLLDIRAKESGNMPDKFPYLTHCDTQRPRLRVYSSNWLNFRSCCQPADAKGKKKKKNI